MQIAKCTLVITPEQSVEVYDLTPADALILYAMHFVGAKGNPLRNIVITGEAQTELTAARPGTPDEFTVDHVLVKRAVASVPATYRKRTDAEERELLRKFYTGKIEDKPAYSHFFGNPMTAIPQKFEEVAHLIGNPEITVQKDEKPAKKGQE